MAALIGPHVGKLGPATKRCSVVVLTYNSMQTIEECLTSVISTIGIDDELIVVDNGSKDGTQHWLTAFKQQVDTGEQNSMALILNDENLGFATGCNVGILASTGEFIILLNPDTRVYEGWIEGLIAPFHDCSVGAVGPLSDNVCGDQFVGPYLSFAGVESSEDLWARTQALTRRWSPFGRARGTKLLVGFCMALRRSVLNQYGGLEETCPLGADDLEMSWRLQRLGYKLYVAIDVFVRHYVSVSFSSLESDRKKLAIDSSDQALIKKFAAYYETHLVPTSSHLWNSPILDDSLDRLKEM